ncbi:hypothetical protein F441_18188, partial [Phytophthora nicotianae CJ01A1]
MRSSRDRIATLERSEKALEDATAQLRRQAEAGDRRLTRLREECGEYQERLESLRDERDQANTQLRGIRERLTKTRSELQSQGNPSCPRSRSGVHSVFRSRFCDGETVTLPPPSNFVQAEPRESHCPTPTPPPPSSIRDRPAGLSPSTRAPKSARTPFSSSAPRDTTSAEQALPAPSPQPSTSANNDVVGSAAATRSGSSFISPAAAQGTTDLVGTSSRSVEYNARDSDLFGSEDDDEDPNYLAALARSRAELRRSHSHEEHRTDL